MRTGRSWSPVGLSMLLAMLLTVTGPGQVLAADPTPQASGEAAGSPLTEQPGATGFPTPEDAVRHYLSGVARGDASMLLEASAIDEMSAGFHFADSVDRLHAMLLTNGLAPAEYPLFADMDRVVVSSQILNQARMLVYSLLSTERLDGTTIAPADRARAEAFVTQVDPAGLAGLTVVDIRYSNAKFEHDPRNLENAAKLAAIYGADELTERLALVELDSKMYEVGFTLLRYGDDWKISSQFAALAGTPALGTAVPTTLEDYDSATSGE
jgi:hypothetical protein